jgi:long-chain acyl-CoA synthetase
MFSNPLSRLLSRTVHLFPVDSVHPGAALETAARILSGGNIVVWFPESWRSPDGKLQRFLPGIGQLLLHSGVSAVPAYIMGTFEALPRYRHTPRFCSIVVTFGSPQSVALLRAQGTGDTGEERVADALHQCVSALVAGARGASAPVITVDSTARSSDELHR